MSENKKGIIFCTRIVKFDEISHLLKTLSIKEAEQRVMKEEQENWKKENQITFKSDDGKKIANMKFFKDCFPKWEYYLNDTPCSEQEAADAVKKGVEWDIQLKVAHGPKLEAYKLLKNEKE